MSVMGLVLVILFYVFIGIAFFQLLRILSSHLDFVKKITGFIGRIKSKQKNDGY